MGNFKIIELEERLELKGWHHKPIIPPIIANNELCNIQIPIYNKSILTLNN